MNIPVRFRPGGPLELKSTTGSDFDIGLTGSSTNVADDVRVGVVIHEAPILILRDRPASNLRWSLLVLKARVVAGEVGAIGDDASDDTVGGDFGHEGEGTNGDAGLDERHLNRIEQ